MNKLEVSILKSERLEALPGSWPKESLVDLLKILDFPPEADAGESEIWEFCLMALGDLEPDEAARTVLKYLLEEDLSEGQINNLSQELLEDKMWEEFPDMTLHEKIYNVNYILYKAFNGKFPKPTAEKLSLEILNEPSSEVLQFLEEKGKSGYLQIMLGALEENALIHRMFGDYIKELRYKEPAVIIWRKELIETREGRRIEIISSSYWLDDLLDHAQYTIDFTRAMHQRDLSYEYIASKL